MVLRKFKLLGGKNLIIILSLALICSACGFRLRTSFELPQELLILNIVGGEESLREQVVKVLKAASVKVDTAAPITLKLANLNFSRRVAAVDANAKPSEYELLQQLNYQLLDAKGTPISAQQQVNVIRSYSFTPEQIAAKQQEENVLMAEMQNELVIKLIRQLPVIPIEFPKQPTITNKPEQTPAQQ